MKPIEGRTERSADHATGAESRDAQGTGQAPGAADGAMLLARMEQVPFSRWHMKARLVMGSATFFDAFNALSLAFALPTLIRLWHISPRQIGLLISASYVGQLAGALVFSALAEKVGRIRGTTAAIAIMSVMSFGCALAGNFPALLVCRLVQGIGVGGEMPVAATYINELSRAHGRGRFFLLYEMIFPLGLMATGQIGAWTVPSFGWSSIFLLGGVPGLVITFLVARLPESPRWLISQGRIAEAERIVEQIEASTARRVAPGPASTAVPTVDLTKRGRWTEVLSHLYRGRTLIVWTLWASAFFIANGLNNWMPSLYNTVYHLNLRESLRAASMTNVAQVLVLLVCAFSIDRVGRRNWTVAAFVSGGVLLAVLGILGAHSARSVMLLGTLGYGLIGSINAVLYLYTPEIYPTRIRAIGCGLATSWLRIASAAGPALVGFLVDAKGIDSVFLMFAAMSVIGAVAATRMVETSDRRLEEIAP
ncbi:MAG TPA: MFS transporter [Bryobacteraceae bacterium]|nr:MFS transporter [Bryobacteraceae bacterium]